MPETKQFGSLRHDARAARTVAMPAFSREQPPPSPQEPPQLDLTVHRLQPPLDRRLVLALEPDSERAAAFRVLRHHLLDRGAPQVIVVASPEGGEGASTCAANLAMALSECDRANVLLVDGNLHRPAVARMFGFAPPWCFAAQLAAHRERPTLPWGIVDIPELWLHVAAVDPRSQQRQLLDAPAFAVAIDRLRRAGYDHIVIDGPAVLHTADVNLMQDAADGVLLAVQRKKTTARQVRQAVEQLSPARVLGTVLLD